MTTQRRAFLAGAAPLILSAAARGASDRPAYGLIGTGNRGRLLNAEFQKLGAQCAALCDVYEPNLELARKGSPAGVKTYGDYREMVRQPGLDFIAVATPDHQHMPNLLAAIGAGKDVYLEKPFSLTLAQSRAMVEAVRKTNRIVQVGMQRRSMAYIQRAREVVRLGMLGEISQAGASWNMIYNAPLDNGPLPGKLDWKGFLGSAPPRDPEPRRFRWWRGFWDYSGGNVTDQGAHLMDVVQFVSGRERPISATANGYTRNMPGAEVPDVFSAALEYPGMLATYSLNYCTGFDADWRVRVYGEEAGMVIDRVSLRVYNTGRKRGAAALAAAADKPSLEEKADFDVSLHLRNFLECIRSRKQPNCPVEVAAAAVAGPHIVNLALRRGVKVKLEDAEKEKS